MEEIISAAIDMLSSQGHTVRTSGPKSSRFEIDGFPVSRREILEIVNGSYSVEDLRNQPLTAKKASR
jgi:hypothetical protein